MVFTLNLGLRNQFGVLIYSLLEQARSQYAVLKRSEMKYEMEEHNDILKQWGVFPHRAICKLLKKLQELTGTEAPGSSHRPRTSRLSRDASRLPSDPEPHRPGKIRGIHLRVERKQGNKSRHSGNASRHASTGNYGRPG
ncbi:hypothetical protein TNCV_2756041 [Trichonephila clavipes]|nr:hypothetical protein TNCV_2756041 [Trichonephila clavipes]